MFLPDDKDVLLSYLNMKLRDQNTDLDGLKDLLEIGEDEFDLKIAEAGLIYDEKGNCFRYKG